MLGISSVGGYGLSGAYWYGYQRAASSAGAVTPVTPVKAVTTLPASGVASAVNISTGTAAAAVPAGQPESTQDMLLRYESDPVGMAVRQRIQFAENAQTAQTPAAVSGAAGKRAEETKSAAEVMEEAEPFPQKRTRNAEKKWNDSVPLRCPA